MRRGLRAALAPFVAALLLTPAGAQTPAPITVPAVANFQPPPKTAEAPPQIVTPLPSASPAAEPRAAELPAPAPAAQTSEPATLIEASMTVAPTAAAPPKPKPYRERPADDTQEGGLWQTSDRAEQTARESGERIKSPELNAYVDRAACAVAAEYCGDLRIYLMQRPFVNAFMTPNGYMEVWSGLLLRADNEAELSFVLGHEISHYVEHHSLEALRATKARAGAAMVLSIGLAVAGAASAAANPNMAQSISDLTQGLVNVVYLGALGSLFGFSREQEAQADALGFARARAAGYDPHAGAAMWRNIIAEHDASDFEKVRTSEARGSLFSTHPLTKDRIEALDALAASAPSGRTEDAAYRAAIRPYLSTWLRDDLRRKDFGETLFLIDHLSKRGEDLGVLGFFKGEAYRLRRKDGDLALAKAAYVVAQAQPDAPAATWRELGYIYARDGQKTEAHDAYAAYLAKAPAASDRALVEMSLKQVTEGATP